MSEFNLESTRSVYGTQLQCMNNFFNIPMEQMRPYLTGVLRFNFGGPEYSLPSYDTPYYYYIPWKNESNEDVAKLTEQHLIPKPVSYVGDNFVSKNPLTARSIYRNPYKQTKDDPDVFYRFFYFCCPCMSKSWLCPLLRSMGGCNCRDCGLLVMPCGHIDGLTPYKGVDFCYGKFRCHDCFRHWSSRYTQSDGSEKCFKCNTVCYPYYQICNKSLGKKLRERNSEYKRSTPGFPRKRTLRRLQNRGLQPVIVPSETEENSWRIETIYFPSVRSVDSGSSSSDGSEKLTTISEPETVGTPDVENNNTNHKRESLKASKSSSTPYFNRM